MWSHEIKFMLKKINYKYAVIILVILLYNGALGEGYIYFQRDGDISKHIEKNKIFMATNEGENGDKDITEKPERYNHKNLPKDIAEYNTSKDRVRVEDAYIEDGTKVAYLTFDDGPSPKVTGEILGVLKSNNIRATFFVVGKNIDANKDILSQIYREGHGIGNHGYTHDYNKIYSNENNFKEEIELTDKAIKKVLGDSFNTRLFRFPGGSFGKSKNHFKDILKEQGRVYVDWNALNGDAEGRGYDEGGLLERLKITVGNSNKVVILMHDTNAKEITFRSLQRIIDYLKSKGYNFKILE